MNVTALVPRRPEPWRDLLWGFVRSRWDGEHPDIPVVAVDDPFPLRPFSRSRSLNAARSSTDADVLIVMDGDVFCDSAMIDPMIAATASSRMVVGFSEHRSLGPTGTAKVLAGWIDGWSDDVIEVRDDNHASLIAIRSELWDSVGGFDERFEGWGWEDVAFRLVCETLLGPMVVLKGTLWHLWHPCDPQREMHNTANRERLEPFIAAQGDVDAMRSVIGS